jgi:hypothetical protein
VKKYQVVRHFSQYNPVDINDFEKVITKYLNQGWECVGGVIYQNYGDRFSVVMQAMTLEDDKT